MKKRVAYKKCVTLTQRSGNERMIILCVRFSCVSDFFCDSDIFCVSKRGLKTYDDIILV